MLGMLALTAEGATGSAYQMLNHGVSTGALFLLFGMLYERRHTRLMRDYGGIAKVMPVFTALFVIITFSSIAVPGTNGFVGEFLVLLGTFKLQLPYGRVIGVIATTGVILGAVYMLWMVQKVFFGPIDNAENRHLKDMTVREGFVLAALHRHDLRDGARAGAVPRGGQELRRQARRPLPGSRGTARTSPPRSARSRPPSPCRARRSPFPRPRGTESRAPTASTEQSRRPAPPSRPARFTDMRPILPPDFIALVPVAILIVGALVLLLAEVFSTTGRARLPGVAHGRVRRSWPAPPPPSRPPPASCSAARRWPTASRASSPWSSAPGSASRRCVGAGWLQRAQRRARRVLRARDVRAAGMSPAGAWPADLLVAFISIEVMSLATYALAAYLRRGKRPTEAAFKYFILGAFSSALLLYGASLVYGATGSLLFSSFRQAPAGSPIYLAGIALVVVGFAFKVAAVPFHIWTPDVYEGAPTPVTAFMAAGVKTAAFAAPRAHLPLCHVGRRRAPRGAGGGPHRPRAPDDVLRQPARAAAA